TPGACCLGFKDGTKCCPASITDAFGQVAVAYHVGDPQIFQINRVVGTEKYQCGLVVKVGALPADVLMLRGQQLAGLLAALAALLALGDALLSLGKLLFRLPIVAWARYQVSLRCDEEHLQPHVYARLTSRVGQRLSRHLGTREADIPAVRF